MSIAASAYTIVNPSFIEPEILIPYNQVSGAFDLIEGSAPKARLDEDHQLVYMKKVDFRSQIAAAAGAVSVNALPGVSFAFSMISTPTYRLQLRSEYNRHDNAAAGRWGASLPELYRLGNRQAMFQLARNLLLYGMNPQNGEGLLNAPNSSLVNLPPDSNGNSTVVTYDAGQMAMFLLQMILNLKTRTNQLGIGREFTICGPQRVLGLFEYPDIVQLVQFQRDGAGSATTAGLFKDILERNGDKISWQYDDTLIGKGAGGTDAVMITMPKIEKPTRAGINTNVFATFSPGNNACLGMYCDMAAPREITSPLAGGATDVLNEWLLTSGWAFRPEAAMTISMLYQ